ncbi:hypothetical protein OGAPHI_004377 [Ogataea philodendri]|uniref:Sorting nexin-4 n=1 Tax=Ogataea philodendri TaxID=1378263 RepID=A0A9P8P5H0_9ASCO|nr:uncharacterized protein OGAPHI_004377 [Ogataea philodendri]KAH3666188.1 hypothetical protein OGAPHI_004377 [Ogataea philodendri]
MSDQFTSVQWDRDDGPSETPPEPQLPALDERSSDSESASEPIDDQDKAEEADESGSGLLVGTELEPEHTPELQHDEFIVSDQTPAEEPQPSPEYYIETEVSSPITEYDGQNPYTSYLIKIRTNGPTFKQKDYQLRRRYSDFNFLYDCLSNDFPTLIIPPLPNKERLEYIKGGRFTDEFTKKRAVSLSIFLARICKHPTLRKSQIFHIFLEDSDSWHTYRSNLKISSGSIDPNNTASQNIETVTDYIMNSFKKPSYDSKYKREFQEIQEKSSKLQENLVNIDHIYSKVLTRQQDISTDFARFSQEFSKLNVLFSNDFDGKNREDSGDRSGKDISDQFSKFGANLQKISDRSFYLNHEIEYDYLTSLRDLENYITQLKNLVKLKEAKALDYEMLSNYLEKAKQEKDRLVKGGSVTSSTEGTIIFLTRKFESMTGMGSHQHGNLTNERIQKLDSRIEVLEKEKKNAFEVFEKFEKDILDEFQLFEATKTDEINESLKSLTDSYLQYYTDLLNDWQTLKLVETGDKPIPTLKNKLSENDELFSSDDVLKNNEVLEQNLQKIHETTSAS